MASIARAVVNSAGAAPARTAVTRLTLTDFRSYGRLRLEPGTAPVVLVGPNGAGKTNIVEALSLLAPGRGLRGARLSDMTRTGAATWAVAASVDAGAGAMEVGTGLLPDGPERRAVQADGRGLRSQVELSRLVGLLWLTPDMEVLFHQGPEARRKFLDRMVAAADPDHAGRVAAQTRARAQRARLLAEGGADAAWLRAAEETLASLWVAVSAARRLAVTRLDRACAEAEGPFPRVGLTLEGDVESWLGEMPALDAEDRLRGALAASRGLDQASGSAGTGLARCDLVLTHRDSGKPVQHCSQGERKALLVAVLLAQAGVMTGDRGATPLLLLDDVLSFLDETRRAALAESLSALGAQAWLTGTDARHFLPFEGRARIYSVNRGVVDPLRAV